MAPFHGPPKVQNESKTFLTAFIQCKHTCKCMCIGGDKLMSWVGEGGDMAPPSFCNGSCSDSVPTCKAYREFLKP